MEGGDEGITMDVDVMEAKDAAALSVAEVVREMRSNYEVGLSSIEVERRKQKHGYNEMNIREDEPLWWKYVSQFKEPLILLLLSSAAISLITKEFDDAISITLAIIIVVTVGFVQEYRSEKSLEAMTQLIPPKCHCIRDGMIQEMLARFLVPGDLVYISVGDRIPADIRLTEAADLEIDESSFTGETTPSCKDIHARTDITNGRIDKLTNICFMGTFVCSGHGKGIVTGTGENSEFGNVFKMMQSEEAPKTPLQKNMDALGKQLSFYSLCIIGGILLLGWFQGRNILTMFTIGVSLAVAAIPEGLPIVVTVTLALGVIRMARKHAIVKRLPVVETLGCVNVVCSDKTGTLTQHIMEATQIYTASRKACQVTSSRKSHGVGSVICDGVKVTIDSHPDVIKAIEVACVCNNAQLEGDKLLGQPTEGALLFLGQKVGMCNTRDRYTRLEERTFSSDQKWMAVCVRKNKNSLENEKGVWFMKGALEVVLRHCTTVYPSNMPLSLKERAHFEGVSAEIGKQGLRVIALAQGEDLNRLCFIGMIGMWDPPRVGVISAISELTNGGVDVKMITGDSLETAQAIADNLGILTHSALCLSGDELDQLGTNPQHLSATVNRTSVFYRVSPRHKVVIIKSLQCINKIVAMTGDGTNDAVAVKRADIGIAMGRAGTDVCREAADMILTDDNFTTILSAVEEGKGIYYNIRNFVRFQLSTSISALSLITLSIIFGLPNPLNAMQILWINIIMDGPPAQSLGVEPVDKDVMTQPPRKATDKMISMTLLTRIVTSAIIIVSGTLWVFQRELQDGIITPRDTTMTFTCFVLFDMFNALTCRSLSKSVITMGVFTNRMFLYAVGGSLLGQLLVIYFPPLQIIFQTEALSLLDIILLCILCSSVLIVDEIWKGLLRWRGKKRDKLYIHNV